jgi:hypothetical protein
MKEHEMEVKDITLRDYFAGQVVAAGPYPWFSTSEVARYAYAVADQMMIYRAPGAVTDAAAKAGLDKHEEE